VTGPSEIELIWPLGTICLLGKDNKFDKKRGGRCKICERLGGDRVFYNSQNVRRRVKMSNRWIIIGVVFTVLFVFLLPLATAGPTKPIKIGVITPLTV